jgi:MFS family permease
MICNPDYSLKVSLFGSVMLGGFMVGSIFLTPWADIIGRKKANQMVSCIQTFAILILTILMQVGFANYWLYISIIFVIGLATASRYNISVLYALEFTTEAHQKVYTAVPLILDGVNSIAIGFEFWQIKSMLPGMWFLVGVQILCIIWYQVYVPESPIFSFKHELTS